MRRLFCFVAVLLFAGSFWIGGPTKVAACSCAGPQPVETALQNKTAVFSGKVLKIEDRNFNLFTESSAYPLTIIFEVKSVWKGPSQSHMIVTTAKGTASCGANLIEGNDYLVYASGKPDKLETGLCDRTKLLQNAAEDLQILGAGKNPEKIVNLESGGAGISKWLLGSGLGLVLPIVFLVYRRLREP
ncbi:hypothetical protein [Bacillus sp. FJAT-27245]|uniref:hypothetical protein n=1 Tax=Bacillus sp. FJAT-27245 TaxID=1684144 RepID=UPI0006A78497|nr:hypothetical protein [Bacillus sp. FJAT-27245]